MRAVACGCVTVSVRTSVSFGQRRYEAGNFFGKSRLEVFLRSNDPAPVVAWATKDHGEAPGHEMMVFFVGWGNLHPKRMADLLDRWPADSAALIIQRLQRAAVDSGQTVNFEIAEVSLGY